MFALLSALILPRISYPRSSVRSGNSSYGRNRGNNWLALCFVQHLKLRFAIKGIAKSLNNLLKLHPVVNHEFRTEKNMSGDLLKIWMVLQKISLRSSQSHLCSAWYAVIEIATTATNTSATEPANIFMLEGRLKPPSFRAETDPTRSLMSRRTDSSCGMSAVHRLSLQSVYCTVFKSIRVVHTGG
jgi:hypothetical protein